MIALLDAMLASLRQHGWCVLPAALDAVVLAQLEADLETRFLATPLCEGLFYGERTRRFGALLRHSSVTTQLVLHPAVLKIVEAVLLPGCERIALNLTQAIEIHPGALPQFPHRDEDMWPGPKGGTEYLINVMWPLTEFTSENGGTRLWTGSHVNRGTVVPAETEAVVPPVCPGDALIFLGSILHGGGGNRSALPRRGVVVSYCLGWLKPFELQWLVYPPGVARDFAPELAALVGYAQHRPNLGNVEGQCPSILLGDDLPNFLPAIDALRADQAEAAALFLRDQQGNGD